MEYFWIIVAIVWILGAILSYRVIEKWGKSTFETVWYSFFWPVMIPLYMIHVWHNRKKNAL